MAKVKSNQLKLKPSHVGRNFTREELVGYHGSMRSYISPFLFITIRNEGGFQNEIHYDGVVHEPEDKGHLVTRGIQNSKAKKLLSPNGTHVLVRYHTNGNEYEYVGDLDYIIRYDEKRNKIIIKQR